MDKLKEWQEKIDNLSQRERAAVFLCALLVVYFAWDIFFMQPLQATTRAVQSQLQQKESERVALNTQIQNLVAIKSEDPDAANREKLQALKLQLNKIERQVEESTRQLISPAKMAVMLESVLLKVKGLKLLQVKGLGALPIVKPVQPEAGGEPEQQVQAAGATSPVGIVDNAYKHGLRIEFQGDYMGTLEYIRELENLEWGFFWESLEFKVNEYPESTTAVTVFTLSLDKNWIGV